MATTELLDKVCNEASEGREYEIMVLGVNCTFLSVLLSRLCPGILAYILLRLHIKADSRWLSNKERENSQLGLHDRTSKEVELIIKIHILIFDRRHYCVRSPRS